MAGKRIVIPNYMPALDLNGNPLPGAKITFYENETTTLASVYANEALTTPLANPVVADLAGVFPSIFADEDLVFTVAINDANDNPIGGLRNKDEVRPSQIFGADSAAAENANAAAQTALAQILDLASGAPDAPSILNKANLDGSNVVAGAFRAAIGALEEGALAGINGEGPLLVVISGQSNALGSNDGGPNPANPQIKTWDGATGAWGGSDITQTPWTRGSPNGSTGRNNYALAFAHAVVDRTGRDVYIVIDGTGGTSITAWTAAGTASVRYAALKAKVEAALATPELAGKTEADLMIWAQGEEDFTETFATHLANVVILDTQLRAESWMAETTPIFCMGMSNLHNRYAPDKALRHYCGKVNQNWVFVSMKGLPTPFDLGAGADATHFTGESLWRGGYERIAGAYFGKERSKEIAILPFWSRGNGELTHADPTAIASFDHLVSWGSRDKSSTTVNSHAASFSIAWGEDCVADGNYSFAFGRICTTDNLCNYTMVGGNTVVASATGDNSIGWGFQINLNANYTAGFGRGHTLANEGATAIGTFSAETTFQADPKVFQVGVGASSGARSNAFDVTTSGIANAKASFAVNGVKVIGAREAAVADATDAATAITQLNALLARCRAHGLIAT